MKIKKTKKMYISDDKVTTMENVQIQYEERDIDLEEVKKIATDSARRIEKNYEKRLNQAIKNNDSYYIRRELKNVSTYDLIKMILHKVIE